MPIFSNGLRGNILGGLAIGIGAAILAPVVVPVLATIVKPLAKGAVKGGFILFEKGKEVAAEAIEAAEDLVAEAKAELAEAQKSEPLSVPEVAQDEPGLKS
ncbi:MAG TPA: DUF5132 domain-containing protein [Thermodesulfobacteriota bacterium]|nr:DUF5132 domain-containing protein [Thermodesulfobacteriota bacterium]